MSKNGPFLPGKDITGRFWRIPGGTKSYRRFSGGIFFGRKFHAIMGLRGFLKKRVAKHAFFCRRRGQKLQFGAFFGEKIR
jgi:hypothetical protein